MENQVRSDFASSEPLANAWTYSFPVIFLAHIAEEYHGGFVERMTANSGIEVTGAAFLIANGFLWIVMLAGIVWVQRHPSYEPLIVAIATAVIVNTLIHIGDTLINASYSPGLFTALLLWLPLGVWALARARKMLAASAFRMGVLIGLVAHALVPVFGLSVVLLLAGTPVGD